MLLVSVTGVVLVVASVLLTIFTFGYCSINVLSCDEEMSY